MCSITRLNPNTPESIFRLARSLESCSNDIFKGSQAPSWLPLKCTTKTTSRWWFRKLVHSRSCRDASANHFRSEKREERKKEEERATVFFKGRRNEAFVRAQATGCHLLNNWYTVKHLRDGIYTIHSVHGGCRQCVFSLEWSISRGIGLPCRHRADRRGGNEVDQEDENIPTDQLTRETESKRSADALEREKTDGGSRRAG